MRRLTFPFLVLLAVPMVAVGCDGTETAVDRSRPPPATKALHAGGNEVTVKGRVTRAYTRHLFAVGTGAQQVIVVVPRGLGAKLGSDVEVTGRVRPFRRAELESELGVALGPEASALEDLDCLVATAATVAPG